ncbi:hypothetical protein MUCCIDRAFT_112950 [Mucor lusitanicus CBS 277.49]|uniref:Uncharacterized protein n=1 Tax=Mucor lusitanicus CBS 277.49 TaxID=747725 RepID=A0A162QF26_MUCCL|nr:hypothetical protein MUCCIDRAFT_112950 [Mucor lusitanicus CBS 277.49]
MTRWTNIANTLILSKLWHVVIHVASFPQVALKKIKSTIYQFVISWLFAPLKGNSFFLPRDQRGLGLVDIGSVTMTFYLTSRINCSTTPFDPQMMLHTMLYPFCSPLLFTKMPSTYHPEEGSPCHDQLSAVIIHSKNADGMYFLPFVAISMAYQQHPIPMQLNRELRFVMLDMANLDVGRHFSNQLGKQQ